MTQLRTERSFVAFFFLGIITLGIYPLVMISHIANEINTIASPHDGKHTMHYCLIVFLFSWLTLGIAPLVWFHRFSNRIGDELHRRGLPIDFGADTFWLWAILCALVCGIGPYVYSYKLIHAMNELNNHYNVNG